MAEHIWTVLCEKTLIDPDSKVITLLDVMESILEDGLGERIEDALRSGKKGVLVNSRMQLVSWWFRSDLKEKVLQARFVLLNPAGESIFEQTTTVEWGKGATTLRVFVRLDKVPVSMLGLYWFVVEHQEATKSQEPRWIAVAKLPLNVDKLEAPPQ